MKRVDQDHSDVLQNLESLLGSAASIGSRWAENRSQLVVDKKSAGQFASNADIEIEHHIRDRLGSDFAGVPIIGEEMGGAFGAETTGWVIDPIDGTSNFILGLPVWGISIGYVENGRSVLGAIALPDAHLIIAASEGHGLRLNGEPVSAERHASGVKIFALGENDFETASVTDARAQTFRDRDFTVVRYQCAVFGLVHSALGSFGGYIEHGCKIWDIAAGDIICREAGLIVHSQKITEDRYAIDARWPD